MLEKAVAAMKQDKAKALDMFNAAIRRSRTAHLYPNPTEGQWRSMSS
jgi:hypothetical protein